MRDIKHIKNYLIGSLIMAAVGIFSVPLLVRLLTQTEFGRWALLEPLLLIGSQLALLGLSSGIIKLISLDGLVPWVATRAILKTGWLPAFLVAISCAFIVRYVGYSLREALYLFLAILTDAFVMIVMNALRASHASFAFGATQSVRGVLSITPLIAAIYGVLNVDEVSDVLIIRLVSGTLASWLGFWLMRRIQSASDPPIEQTRPMKDMEVYWVALCYGFPLLVTALLTLTMDYFSRYLLAAYIDIALLAQYVVYTKFVSGFSLIIVTPFSLWWPTERFRRLRKSDGGRGYFSWVALIFLMVLLAAAGTVWLVSGFLLVLFAPSMPDFPMLIGLLLLGAVFAGMAYPLNVGLLNEGKTHYNIYTTLIGAIANILLCVALVPRFGMIGAASATMLSYFVYTLIILFLSQKVYYVPFAYNKMLLLGAGAVGILQLVAYFIPSTEYPSLMARIFLFLLGLFLMSLPLYYKLYRWKRGLGGSLDWPAAKGK
ncbi:MAG: polysaccharide biosynthesis C-terminal domain-containing protein [Desulfamplus sp.]|nr:polysaccharide biosynthesis C-terminal domain-containing protein [Desulfamplus sp.]